MSVVEAGPLAGTLPILMPDSESSADALHWHAPRGISIGRCHVVMRNAIPSSKASAATLPSGYAAIRGDIVELLDAAMQAAALNVNSLMTASYWEVGRRVVEPAEMRVANGLCEHPTEGRSLA